MQEGTFSLTVEPSTRDQSRPLRAIGEPRFKNS